MKHNNVIQVFEHKSIIIGNTHGFTKQHWEALGWYNEKHGGTFFSLTPKGVKFNQYVGVIQVGNLTIEVLPKIGQSEEDNDKTKWQKILIDMLRECRWMQVYAQEKASLKFKPNSILEAYLELYIQECENLIRIGLIKKYRTLEKNCTALKGKLLFNEQLKYNFIHKERFFTRHQTYDKNNTYNQILLKALKLVPSITQSPFLKDRIYNLLLSFPELEDISVLPSTIDNLVFDRKTLHYKNAIEIAAMLLLNYRPDINAGRNHVLAILFDMNDLWEEYIYRQLVKNKFPEWTIKSQNSKKFWNMVGTYNVIKTIRPDIVIHDNLYNINIILDTKWKIPYNDIPSDADLKQMFIYNEYWQAKNTFLIYPDISFHEIPRCYKGRFERITKESLSRNCGIIKTSVLNANNKTLDTSVGKRINQFLKNSLNVFSQK